MNAITVTLRGGMARALDAQSFATNAETAIREVCQELLDTGMSPELPVAIQENGWFVARIPTLRAAADPKTFDAALRRKLDPTKRARNAPESP